MIVAFGRHTTFSFHEVLTHEVSTDIRGRGVMRTHQHSVVLTVLAVSLCFGVQGCFTMREFIGKHGREDHIYLFHDNEKPIWTDESIYTNERAMAAFIYSKCINEFDENKYSFSPEAPSEQVILDEVKRLSEEVKKLTLKKEGDKRGEEEGKEEGGEEEGYLLNGDLKLMRLLEYSRCEERLFKFAKCKEEKKKRIAVYSLPRFPKNGSVDITIKSPDLGDLRLTRPALVKEENYMSPHIATAWFNRDREYRPVILVRFLTPPRSVSDDLKWGAYTDENWMSWSLRQLSRINFAVGTTLAPGKRDRTTSKENLILVGITLEIQRYFNFTGGIALASEEVAENVTSRLQYYIGVTLDLRVFQDLGQGFKQ